MKPNSVKIIDIQEKIISQLLTVCQKLRDDGFNDQEIQKYVRDHHQKKSFDFYKTNVRQMHTIFGAVVEGLKEYDSKIEAGLYKIFQENNIPFKFQYKIGPYRADYLLWGFLIVELDGPQHEYQKKSDQKRDRYLIKMGYQVIRIPTWVLINEPDKVIELVLSYKPKEKPKSKRKKRNTKPLTLAEV